MPLCAWVRVPFVFLPGVYTNNASGVAVSRTRYGAGTYVVVPSTFDPVEATYTVTCFSSARVKLTHM